MKNFNNIVCILNEHLKTTHTHIAYLQCIPVHTERQFLITFCMLRVFSLTTKLERGIENVAANFNHHLCNYILNVGEHLDTYFPSFASVLIVIQC